MRLFVACLLLALPGCGLFFPPQKAAPDGGAGDGGTDLATQPGTPRVAGQLCLLADIRDYRTCLPARGTFRLTVEETGDTALSAADGRFVVPLLTVVELITLIVIDPRGELAGTVAPLQLRDGVLDPVAVPLVPNQTALQLSFQAGVALDNTRGTLLAWAVDPEGRPVRGVAAARPAGVGPFYEGFDANQLDVGNATGPRGLIALFDLAPGRVSLQVSPPPPMRGDTFPLPIRGGGFTVATLVQQP
jgi:hypothetical protein